MPLGLMVACVVLIVITVVGTLGYLMDKQVDRENVEERRAAAPPAESESGVSLSARK